MNASGGIRLPVLVSQGHQGGFTLIELIVVLLVITVLAGAVAPALVTPAPAKTDMEEAVNRFDTLFRLARDSAVRSASSVIVVLDSISGLVWFDAPGSPSAVSSSAVATAISGQATTIEAGNRVQTGRTFGGLSTLGSGFGAPGAGIAVPADALALALPDGITIEYLLTRSFFTFMPAGSATGDSLRLRSTTGQTCLITIDPWSGHVRVR